MKQNCCTHAQSHPADVLIGAIRPATRRRAAALGVGAGLVTALLYAIASGRELTFDGAISYGSFIATPHLSDSWSRQIGYNNHLLFSTLEHLVYTLSGSGSEALLRVLPIGCGAATVGLVGYAAARWHGWLGGLVAVAFLAGSPLFATESRELRGYSLLCLCAVGASLVLPEATRAGGRRSAAAGYAGLVAAGVATHLYMVMVLLGHGVWVLASGGDRAQAPDQEPPAHRRSLSLVRWLVLAAAGAALGLAAYGAMLSAMAGQSAGGLGTFTALFPVELGLDLFGGSPLAAVVLLPLAAMALLRVAHADQRAGAVIATYLALALLLWLAIRPFDLYARFFIWLLPAIAVVLAATVRRIPALAAVALAGTALAVLTHLAVYTADPLAFRAVADQLRRDQAAGLRVCVLAGDDRMLRGWLGGVATVRSTVDLDRCDAVASVSDDIVSPDLLPAARQSFPTVITFPALRPGVVLYRAGVTPGY